MNSISHFFGGFIVGMLLLFTRVITLIDIIIILTFSTLIDLDHVVNYLRKENRYHLRSFVQEPLAIPMIGIPVGLILSFVFNSFIYFWLVIGVYSSHIILDYICTFEALPLDPFSKKYKKPETKGFIFPLWSGWGHRRPDFPDAIDEIYVMIPLGIVFTIILVLHVIL